MAILMEVGQVLWLEIVLEVAAAPAGCRVRPRLELVERALILSSIGVCFLKASYGLSLFFCGGGISLREIIPTFPRSPELKLTRLISF
jgi:hypothetical protein